MSFHPKQYPSQSLPKPLSQLRFTELVQFQQTLFAQIDALHVGSILRGWARDSAGDDYGVGLEDNAVVNDFVDGEGREVVVLDQGALVDGVSARVGRSVFMFQSRNSLRSRATHFRRMFKLSRSASTTL
jgi:hypothetical protein